MCEYSLKQLESAADFIDFQLVQFISNQNIISEQAYFKNIHYLTKNCEHMQSLFNIAEISAFQKTIYWKALLLHKDQPSKSTPFK